MGVSRSSRSRELEFSRSSRSSASDTEGEDVDPRVSEGQCTWCVEGEESVYNDGLYRIATAHRLLKRHGRLMFICNMIAVSLLLGFNLTLQWVVISRVRVLVDQSAD